MLALKAKLEEEDFFPKEHVIYFVLVYSNQVTHIEKKIGQNRYFFSLPRGTEGVKGHN